MYNAKKDKHLENYFIYFKNASKLGAKKVKARSHKCQLPAIGNSNAVVSH